MLGTPTSGTQDFSLAPHQCVLCPQTLSENIFLPGMLSQQTVSHLYRALRVRPCDEGRDVWLFLLFSVASYLWALPHVRTGGDSFPTL